MTGWGADGRTRPTWRSCAHLYMDGDRCDSCKARRVHAEQNERPAGGGIPLGSPLLIRPDLKGLGTKEIVGDEKSKDRFMGGKAHL